MNADLRLRSRSDGSLRCAPAALYGSTSRASYKTLDSPGAKRKRRRGLFFAGFLLLAGYLLLCHGCHGDEDNELIVTFHLWKSPILPQRIAAAMRPTLDRVARKAQSGRVKLSNDF